MGRIRQQNEELINRITTMETNHKTFTDDYEGKLKNLEKELKLKENEIIEIKNSAQEALTKANHHEKSKENANNAIMEEKIKEMVSVRLLIVELSNLYFHVLRRINSLLL